MGTLAPAAPSVVQAIDVDGITRALDGAKEAIVDAIRAELHRQAPRPGVPPRFRLTPTPEILAPLAALFERGRREAAAELDRAGVTLPRRYVSTLHPRLDDVYVRIVAGLNTIANRAETDVGRTVLDQVRDVTTARIDAAIDRVPGLRAVAASLVSESFIAGTADLYEENADAFGGFVATSVLDGNTCPSCSAVDGTVYPTIPDAARAGWRNGGWGPYEQCLGGPRCRCRIVPIPGGRVDEQVAGGLPGDGGILGGPDADGLPGGLTPPPAEPVPLTAENIDRLLGEYGAGLPAKDLKVLELAGPVTDRARMAARMLGDAEDQWGMVKAAEKAASMGRVTARKLDDVIEKATSTTPRSAPIIARAGPVNPFNDLAGKLIARDAVESATGRVFPASIMDDVPMHAFGEAGTEFDTRFVIDPDVPLTRSPDNRLTFGRGVRYRIEGPSGPEADNGLRGLAIRVERDPDWPPPREPAGGDDLIRHLYQHVPGRTLGVDDDLLDLLGDFPYQGVAGKSTPVPGPLLQRQTDHLLRVGRLVDDEIEEALRVAGVRTPDAARIAQMEETIASLQEEYDARGTRLSRRAEIHGLIKNLRRGLTEERSVGAQDIGRIRRDVITRVLDRHGGRADGITLTGAQDTAADAIQWAARWYPRHWVEASDRHRLPLKNGGMVARGSYGSGTVKLSRSSRGTLLDDVDPNSGPGTSGSVAVHELGHRFEDAVEGITEHEWAMLRRRLVNAGGRVTERAQKVDGMNAWRDGLGDLYAGKRYEHRAPLVASGEVLTMHAEAYFTGSYSGIGGTYGGSNMTADPEWRRWFLGVLLTAGRRGVGSFSDRLIEQARGLR